MNEIVKRVREVFAKTGKSQTAFAKEIGVTPAYIWKILNNDDVSPSDRTISDICEKFHVSEVWLRTGEGDPHIKMDDDAEFIKICEQINMSDDDLIKRIIKAYWYADEKSKAAIRALIDSFTT